MPRTAEAVEPQIDPILVEWECPRCHKRGIAKRHDDSIHDHMRETAETGIGKNPTFCPEPIIRAITR